MTMKMDLNVYYDAVCKKLTERGYSKAPDLNTVEEDWSAGKSIDTCVAEFEEEWGDPGDEEVD